jgi:hypothetical protein
MVDERFATTLEIPEPVNLFFNILPWLTRRSLKYATQTGQRCIDLEERKSTDTFEIG